MKKRENTPQRGGPGSISAPVEKAKDFKKSVVRLFKELGIFKYFIILAVFLSMASSVIAIIAPKYLTKLTDEITAGLMVDKNVVKKLSIDIGNNLKNISREKVLKIIDFKVYDNTFYLISNDSDISNEEEERLGQLFLKSDNSFINEISTFSDKTLSYFLEDSIYDGVEISEKDKIKFIKALPKLNTSLIVPDSIKKVLVDDISFNGVKINSYKQLKYLELMSFNIKDKKKASVYLFKQIDKMPKNIKKIIEPNMNMRKIKSIGFTILIIYIISALLNFLEHIIMANTSNRFGYRLRRDVSSKIDRLPLKYFDKNSTGSVMSIVTNDIDTITQSLNQSAALLVSSTTLLLGSLIMMFSTNFVMALSAVLSSLIGFVFIFIILKTSQKYFVQRQKELANLNGHIEEIYSSLNVVKAYNGKEYADKKFDKYNKLVYHSNIMSQFLSGLMQPAMIFIGNFSYVVVCIVGAILTMKGEITFGVIVAFITYVRLFTQPLSQLAQGLNALQSVAASSERVFNFMDEEELRDESKLKNRLDIQKAKGEIEFKNVFFTYDGNDKPTIKGFNAKVHSGQKIAIVGPTGAGKTTLVNLLMKFYDIDSGDIIIDGHSIHDLSRENIHDLFTMVLQDTWLFEGSVKDNLKYNNSKLTDREIEQVCEVVGLDHYIKTLPGAYNAKISSGDNVSAGERQLLTIARGMLKKSPFLILDEATSNVDTRTEEVVQVAMDKLMEGKTSFVIAHRLSTIKNASLILVVKDGNIIEQGTHEELLEKRGFYSELYNSQFEL